MKTAIALLTAAAILFAQSTAEYRMELEVIWDNETHPHPTNNFPNGPGTAYEPHFSAPVGAVHNSEIQLWKDAGIASDALKETAESGGTAKYLDSIANYLNSGTATLQILLSGGDAPGSKTTSFTVTESHPLVSFASMLAPTPDWFFGLESYSLRTDNGWIDSVTIDLYPYDAGTKDGDNYSYSYPETSPREPVRSLKGVAPFSEQPVTRVTLIRTDATALSAPVHLEKSKVTVLQLNRELRYTLSGAQKHRFTLYSLQGKELFSQELIGHNFTIQLPGSLSRGVYLASLTSPSLSYQHKVQL